MESGSHHLLHPCDLQSSWTEPFSTSNVNILIQINVIFHLDHNVLCFILFSPSYLLPLLATLYGTHDHIK